LKTCRRMGSGSKDIWVIKSLRTTARETLLKREIDPLLLLRILR